jgi:hypothetical protein
VLTFDVAQQNDDAALRRLLRENAMEGDIRLTLEREPNVFHAATIAGEFEQILVARANGADSLLAMGSRSVMTGYVNGQVQRLGYLGQLRVDRHHRGRKRLLTGGYAALRDLHRDGATSFYVTAIVADNRSARRILEAGLDGLPTYRPLESLLTLVMPVRKRPRHTSTSLIVECGAPDNLDEIVECLERNGLRHQFTPRWTRDDLLSSRTRDLHLRDVRLARRHGHVVGCLAGWDQTRFKQTVVRGYSRRLGVARPVLNTLAPLRRVPRLPPPGRALRNAFISHLAIDDDDPDVLLALLNATHRHAATRSLDYLILTVALRHSFVDVVKRAFSHREYHSVLYVVHWEDGAAAAAAIDSRIPHLEAALL